MFASNKESKVILGPVIKAGLEALKVYAYMYVHVNICMPLKIDSITVFM